MLGRRFGKLVVVAYSDTRSGAARWKCVCDCGNEHVVFAQMLKRGTTHCGCERYSKRSVADRFWEKVERRGPDECWEWIGARSAGKFNYGRFGFSTSRPCASTRNAHTVAWELDRGRKLPRGKVVRHRCDNPPCCNPKHLVMGTQKQNVADMIRRGRQAKGAIKRGSAHGMSILTESIVLAMRAEYAAGATAKSLAEKYGVGHATAAQAISRYTWRHI